jgi:hypothetical protein
MGKQKDRRMDGQIDKQRDLQMDGQTDGQANKQTETKRAERWIGQIDQFENA